MFSVAVLSLVVARVIMMLNVIMLTIFVLSVVILGVAFLILMINVIALTIFVLSVIILGVVLLLYRTNYLNEEANCTEPSPSVRVPCFRIALIQLLPRKKRKRS